MTDSYWRACFENLRGRIDEQDFDLLIRPLQVRRDGAQLELLAPNRYVIDALNERYSGLLNEALCEAAGALGGGAAQTSVRVDVGSLSAVAAADPGFESGAVSGSGPRPPLRATRAQPAEIQVSNQLNEAFTFDNFIEGRSNELARAAAHQVSQNAGSTYNPLLIYGGVGLGKTHLMHAVGLTIRQSMPDARVLYVHSQRFVQDMVDALHGGTMQQFTEYYRSSNALLIDDVQFFANKLRSQDEFFSIFSSLLERGQQIVLTSDRYPREIDGLEERLKSRFVWGLTVEVEAPELETRVAILRKKAEACGVDLDTDVAFYIAERIRTNVRELEGALKRTIASARFKGAKITIDQVQHALRDLFAVQSRMITVDKIQKATAEYYNVKVADLLSKRRSRSIVRPRQMAMALSREFTQNSLPDIGQAFGGKDHTTVMHACNKIAELKESDPDIMEDYRNLSRLLNT
ncbi:MAG: chromosomal replication initiator protein DnaA [Pseudomonadota bacterium]